MEPFPGLDQAERSLHLELHACLRTVQELAGGDPSSLEDGIERLRHLRKAVFESINQIQHEGLILKAIRWLEKGHGYGPNAEWEWNPRQTGTADEPDLRVKIDGEIEVSGEATASEKPIGGLDTRMSQTLTKLNAMPGKKFYFVRTETMALRAKRKISRGEYDIEVILL